MFALFNIFIAQPWVAAIPAALLSILWRWSGSRTALAASVLWALYMIWEWSIHAGYACSGDCNIRVDLLLIAPLLLLVSAAGLVRAILRKRRTQG